jgi:putative ABC transport system ATP-binding protein
MNIISGVLVPDVGGIHIDGKNVTTMSEFKRSKMIGRVFQDPMAGTAPSMTIEENLAMAYSRKKQGPSEGESQKKGVITFGRYLNPCILV